MKKTCQILPFRKSNPFVNIMPRKTNRSLLKLDAKENQAIQPYYIERHPTKPFVQNDIFQNRVPRRLDQSEMSNLVSASSGIINRYVHYNK